MKYQIPVGQLLILTIISFVLVYFGGNDAINSSKKYNSLDLENPIEFEITDKLNMSQKHNFFDELYFSGSIINFQKENIDLKISKGEFDKFKIGEKIKIYKGDANTIMTKYQIDNHLFIEFNGNGYSFVFIPVFLFSLIGLVAGILFIKKTGML